MIEEKKLLYIEDNPGDVRLFEKMVSACPMQIDVHVANKFETGTEMVRQNHYDAILLDLELPDSQGLDSIKTLIEICPDTPVIVLTGDLDETVGKQAIQAGAQDYLVKGIDYTSMIHRIIQNAIERKDIEDRLRTSEERVMHLNAVLRAIRDINQLVTHATIDRDQFIQDVCDHLIRALDFNNVWIALVDETGQYPVCVNAGFNHHFEPVADKLASGILPPCGKMAMDQDGIVIIKNTQKECPNCMVSPDSRSKSIFIINLASHGKHYGLFSVGMPHYFIDDEEVQELFAEMADDIAFALYRFDVEDQRKMAEQQIRSALIEKEALLKEIHHRVKNNLQIIMSLLNLQSSNIRDPQALKVFRESRLRVHSISMVHEKLYRSENLSEISFGEYTASIVKELIRAYRQTEKVSIEVNIQDIFLGVDLAIPLGLIINELMTNALKYAFPDQRHGKIMIDLESVSDQHYVLSVSDNGVGIDKDVILKESGLGIQLVGILTEQLEGHLQIESQNGSQFTIKFPKHI